MLKPLVLAFCALAASPAAATDLTLPSGIEVRMHSAILVFDPDDGPAPSAVPSFMVVGRDGLVAPVDYGQGRSAILGPRDGDAAAACRAAFDMTEADAAGHVRVVFNMASPARMRLQIGNRRCDVEALPQGWPFSGASARQTPR